jgi:molecular chaperone GrpE
VTVPTENPETQDVHTKLDYLTSLFQRQLISALDERLRQAEVGPFRQYLLPFVSGIALLLDRMERYEGPDPSLAVSVRDELLELLAAHGVQQVPASGRFDPALHEVAESRVDPAVPPGQVIEVFSCGLTHESTVLRPARVVVSAVPRLDA